MRSFKTTIVASIKRKAFTREYYEEVVANWLLHNWLTDEEAEEVFKALDEIFTKEKTK